MAATASEETNLNPDRNPSESPDLSINECIVQTRDAMLAEMPTKHIIAQARSQHPRDYDAARAEVMARVYNWLHENVEESAFDPDIFIEARRQSYETLLSELTKTY